MTIVITALRGIAVCATLLVGYNMFTLAVVAMGKHVDYVPWLHFPLKFFFG